MWDLKIIHFLCHFFWKCTDKKYHGSISNKAYYRYIVWKITFNYRYIYDIINVAFNCILTKKILCYWAIGLRYYMGLSNWVRDWVSK
jgi:hypothetical protein